MKRRNFIKKVGIAAIAANTSVSVKASLSEFSDTQKLKGKKVAIIGGGIAGLSAAHELIERGFEVSVFEAKTIPGGKARSLTKKGTSTPGRDDLPGEHGFRYFPGFYKHIPDLMGRTPFGDNKNGCLGNLVNANHLAILTEDTDIVYLPLKVPRTFEDFREAVEVWVNRDKLGLTKSDVKFFSKKLYQILTSCNERRINELEKISWWDFIEAEKHSVAFQKFLADGLTNLLVAMRPKDGSARTIGVILTQQILSLTRPAESMDRVLNGPTNDVWIDPWLRYLVKKGVDYQLETRISHLDFDGKKITGLTTVKDGVFTNVEADIFILAVPLDVANKLIHKKLRSADRQFQNMLELRDEWMVGIQFYLTKKLNLAKGHMMYLDAPWGLTSVHQAQFWKKPLDRYGNGDVKEILSVDISNWGTKGILYGKNARECTKEEIKNEVLAQLKTHLNREQNILDNSNIKDWMLDPGIRFFADGTITNDEPLLINTNDSYKNRPSVKTNVSNLFLASDYVKTHTDLATMEAAAEAAKRAVNAILEAKKSSKTKCQIHRLKEPTLFEAAKFRDWLRWKRGLPHRLEKTKSKIFRPNSTL